MAHFTPTNLRRVWTDESCRFHRIRRASVTTKIYDRASGGHEHSQLGATTLWQSDFFDWIDERFG
jgi:hypothetical protein